MMRIKIPLAIGFLMALGGQVSPVAGESVSRDLEFCFAPGTPQEVVERAYSHGGLESEAHSLSDPDSFRFRLNPRWSSTATDGSGLGQGDPTVLTWGFVPDGTSISGGVGEPSAPSNLIAFLNGIYGPGNWLPIFQQVFDRWQELTGISYVYEPNDDGAGFVGSPGVVGVRADVRIGGHLIDGNSGILAYNYYPNSGDMVIDTADSFYSNTGGNSIRLRNVLAHEHGHGMGLKHVCPVNQSKLMEPFLTTSFDGPQHDDILGANRSYGDIAEDDDSQGTAFQLGSLGGGVLLQDLSIDDNSDVDFLEFGLSGVGTVDVTITPVGYQYLEGPQNGSSCTAGTMFNSQTIHDLTLTVRDSSGSIVASADENGVGESEQLTSVPIPDGGGFVEVGGDSTDNSQLYTLEMTSASQGIFSDGFESGSTSAWSQAVQ